VGNVVHEKREVRREGASSATRLAEKRKKSLGEEKRREKKIRCRSFYWNLQPRRERETGRGARSREKTLTERLKEGAKSQEWRERRRTGSGKEAIYGESRPGGGERKFTPKEFTLKTRRAGIGRRRRCRKRRVGRKKQLTRGEEGVVVRVVC